MSYAVVIQYIYYFIGDDLRVPCTTPVLGSLQGNHLLDNTEDSTSYELQEHKERSHKHLLNLSLPDMNDCTDEDDDDEIETLRYG